MTAVQALILGLLQGLTEFLPISSSAHLAVAPALLGWEASQGLAFDVALHVGTLAAVLTYFWRDWWSLGSIPLDVLRRRQIARERVRLAVFLVVATIPAVFAGLLLESYAETVFRAPAVIAGALAGFGLIMWSVDRRLPSNRQFGGIGLRDAVVFGLAQVLALVPGVSRSGATITAGRALALDRVSAARFSFLMSMPVIAGAAIVKVPDVLADTAMPLTTLVTGVLAAAISGWLAIGLLLRIVAVRGLGMFAAYRVVLALIIYAVLVLRS